MTMRLRGIAQMLSAAMIAVGCSTTKFVGDGSYLLDKVEVSVDGKYKDINTLQLKNYLRQTGNSRWFSTLKIPLATYSLSGRDSSWMSRVLRSIGEAPVIYDSMLTRRACDDLRAELQNEGYLAATVDVFTKTKGKKMRVNYVLHPREPFFIRSVKYDIRDKALEGMLRGMHVLTLENRGRMKFSAVELNNERKRITDALTNIGYYRFHKDYITYIADTVRGSRDIDITLVLHNYRTNNIDDAPHPQYTIRSVSYLSGQPGDSVIRLRRKVIHNNTFIEPGQMYSAKKLQQTYNHFGRLQAVKYTNISFDENPATHELDCKIQLSTNKPHTISFEPEGTNTAGDLGAAATLAYQNRNLFHGSEQLSVKLRGAYEAIRGLEGYSNQNFLEYSIETNLMFPRFIAPFLSKSFRRRINATSQVSLLYDLQNRPEYHRRVFAMAWKYRWNDDNHHDRYQIDLLDLNFISMPWISETFKTNYLDDASSRNAILRYNYEDLLIMKIGFGYAYNNGRYAIKANVETAGNVLNAAARMFHFSKNDMGQYKVARIAYAQYVKGDIEYTRNIRFGYNSELVLHAGFGIAYPYGNSTVLPFEKRYFSGGANSVRGWSVRSLGPGRYVRKDGNIDFINQTGDMKLDLNVEYRAHLFWKIFGALFVDAGNIWTLRAYDEQPGGQFRFDTFLKELAASYGLGIRFNFDFFIVRFDMGMKAVNPAYETSKDHFPIIHPKLSRDFAFHFAVGMPF